MKFKYILLSFFCVLSFHIAGQETTNPFLDLDRKGNFEETHSEMAKKASVSSIEQFLIQNSSVDYLCFPEDRFHSIRFMDSIPAKWTTSTDESRKKLGIEGQPGEFLTFQIGVWAIKTDLDNLKISFSDFSSSNGKKISAFAFQCFNSGGVGSDGKPLTLDIDVSKGHVQPLWMGAKLPDSQGIYRGIVTVKPENAPAVKIEVSIDIKGEKVANNGDNEGWRKSRLHWLNSNIGFSDQPTKPYIPVSFKGKEMQYLGGKVELSVDGLPERIATNYDQNIRLSDVSNAVLAEGMTFEIETSEGGIEKMKCKDFKIIKKSNAELNWQVQGSSPNFNLLVSGIFSFEGFSEYRIEVTAKNDLEIKDIRLLVPFTEYSAKYMMGLNQKGGYRPSAFAWKWDVNKNQDMVWIGNVNSGIRLKLKDENYSRPLVNIYYSFGRLNMPSSWENEGKGGIRITEKDSKVVLEAYSGQRKMQKGQKLNYNFDLLVTPLKPLDMKSHVKERYYHSNSDLSGTYIPEALKNGANVINIHHKKDINPFINYPYYDESVGDLKQFIDSAHSKGLKTKLYYTTRELTVKIPEIWALRSLKGEVIKDGPGKDARTLIHRNGPNQWLIDNFGYHFVPAWYNAFNEGKYKGDVDISVLTTPDSRWNNYYLAGLDWMVKNIGIDGVYIDDSALDRLTMQRSRRILDQDGKRRMIDMHSWNHYNEYAAYANSTLLYLDLFPYADKLWLGEGFGAENSLDFWLVEMSGIPWGIYSEMLDARNPWRGMVFGMTSRLPWSGNPTPIWKLWDDFGMEKASIHGYWDEKCPVKSNNPEIPATVYINRNKALVVLANWTDCSAKCKLEIDTDLLGFVPTKTYLPEIKNTQWSNAISIKREMEVPGRQGLFIILEKE